MRIVRVVVALVGSLILLVATAVSLINRRGDVRDEQVATVEFVSTVTEQSVRNSLDAAADLVDLAALAAVDIDTGSDREDGAPATRRLATARRRHRVRRLHRCVLLRLHRERPLVAVVGLGPRRAIGA